MHYIWLLFQLIVGYNLIVPFLLFLCWSLFKKPVSQTLVEKESDYAIIITAYEQTDSVRAAVESVLKLKYANYIIYVVADNCNISTLTFTDDRVIVLKPNEVLASNTKSHLYAVDRFKRSHDYITIIDSDNLVHENYLKELNKFFDLGFLAVQGSRMPKNIDTVYAGLDAARDMYYHFYDGKLLFELGSSATLSGSGMAFDVFLYKEFLNLCQVKGAGFDKVLQQYIVGKGLRIAFNEHAIVYDEKTSKSDQLVKQRSRWINTWFKYFGLGFGLIRKGVQNFSFNQFVFGIILLRPPLFIFILLSGICMVANFFFSPLNGLIWILVFLIFVLSFFISLFHAKADARIYRSLYGIPKFIMLQLMSLVKSRNANRHSVATQHFHNQVNNK